MGRVFENDVILLDIEDDIIIAKYKCSEINLEVAKKAIEFRLKVQKGRKIKILLYADNIKSVSANARAYLVGPMSYEGLLCGAFVLDSRIKTALGNVYIKYGSIPVPTKLFRTKEKALEWLSQY
ncbi:MAG: hypothetical protein ACPGLV_18265 [Bacteroidia bacterium]